MTQASRDTAAAAASNEPLPSYSFQRAPAADDAQYPIPARLNLLIIALQLSAVAAIFYATSQADTWWQLALLAVAMGIVGNSIYSIIHEAEHRMLHPNAWINDVLGAGMALLFPAPYHLIRQGHLGHHQRNRSDDEAFDLYFAGENPFLRHLQLYGILTGAYWVMVALSNFVALAAPLVLRRKNFEFNRPSAALMDSLNPRYWWLISLEGALAILLHVGVIFGLGIVPWKYFCVYFGFGFSWSAMQYVHHFATDRHVLRGARNLWFFAPIDWIWLHHNWHLAHHCQPTVPWIYLPRLAATDDDAPPREFLGWHYLRMWRGPRYSDEHVQNRFAGRVIQ